MYEKRRPIAIPWYQISIPHVHGGDATTLSPLVRGGTNNSLVIIIIIDRVSTRESVARVNYFQRNY